MSPVQSPFSNAPPDWAAVDDLRSVYLNLLEQGIRYDLGLLDQSLARLGIARLKS
jgi:hypothetical protein